MATFAFTDALVKINSVDLSDHITKVTITAKVDELENTAFGATYHGRTGGLVDGSISIDFNQDFASGKVDATVWPLLGTSTTVSVRPTSAATSATNPVYSGSFLVSEYQPLDGGVGDLTKVSVTWPSNGAISRATS